MANDRIARELLIPPNDSKLIGVPIMRLRAFDCRWVHPDGSWCGKPVAIKSWCAEHAAIVVGRSKPR